VLEFTQPVGAVPRALVKVWLNGFVPVIAALVGRRDARLLLRYCWDTVAACVPPGKILQAVGAAGFVDVERHVELAVFSAYRARKPA